MVMKERNDKELPRQKDRHLDIPSEANRDKHVNFLDNEDNGGREDIRSTSEGNSSPFYIPNNTPLKQEDKGRSDD